MFSWTIVTWFLLVLCVGVVPSEGDVVKNVSVGVVAIENEPETFGVGTTIKLNVSWLPPENDGRDFSYSVVVIAHQVNSTETVDRNSGDVKEVSGFCPEGFLSYFGQDVNQTHVLLPEDRFISSKQLVSELDIKPACSYAVYIYANPRNNVKHAVISTSTVFTVPECVGRRCNCDAMSDLLPVPVVSVVNPYNGGTLISWKVESKKSIGDRRRTDVKSYKISVGIPYLTPSNDEVIYNKTLIFAGTTSNNSFYWKEEKLKKGTKFFASAENLFGCSGREGTHSAKRPRHRSFYRKNLAAIVFAGLLAIFLMISGLFNFVKSFMQNHKYKFLSWRYKHSREFTSALLHNPKIEVLLKNENILNADKKITMNL